MTSAPGGHIHRQRGPNALVLQGVRRSFDDHVVLDGVDLTIPHGQFVAMLGRSGSGKSTLLRIVANLDCEAEGDVFVPERRAVVFQDPRLIPWKRVTQNITLGVDGPAVRERAREVLADVGLVRHATAWPMTLSGGEAQRVALARALIRDPQLLLLDEPFGALDALTRIKMHTLLIAMRSKYHPAILFVTHDVEEALLLADRVVVLDGGRIAVDETVQLESPRRRTSGAFQAMREQLLIALGVDDSDRPTG
jgi:sulfonate transport system ATP-binding protein